MDKAAKLDLTVPRTELTRTRPSVTLAGAMPDPFPLQLLLATVAGAQIVAYLVEENRVLRKQLGKKRPRLTVQRRRWSWTTRSTNVPSVM